MYAQAYSRVQTGGAEGSILRRSSWQTTDVGVITQETNHVLHDTNDFS